MKASSFKNGKTKRIHAFVSGKVQGVFFRASTAEEAKKEGIDGWVRNTNDGRVEVVAEGDEEALKKFIEFLKKGPAGAWVEGVTIKEEKQLREKGFTIKR